MSKPSLPKGTRDFLPEEVAQRQYIFDTIRSVFKQYSYQPIETPVMENLSTLTGKYGDEGDQLLFKVLNNGDYLAKADQAALEAKDSKKLTSSISKRGLRYDLTVPFARFVVMHQNDIAFPFKRYAIMPVWRADRPQKGRYQEFYQCDVDVVGSTSMMYEAELVKIYDEVFHKLGIPVEIKVNNRKILEAIAHKAGIADQFVAMVTAIDKLDKVGEEGVINEMAKSNITAEAAQSALDALRLTTLSELENTFGDIEVGAQGIAELREFHKYLDSVPAHNDIVLDLTLARGLSYYTGCIFEVKAKNVQMGSIGGGGRYDDLTGMFGLKGVSGVGVSFGAERIYDVMTELGLFDDAPIEQVKAILLAFDTESHLYAFQCAQSMRSEGISVDIYPSPTKMNKQMKYANTRGFQYALIVGDEELKQEKLMVKNLKTGDQELMSLSATQELLSH